VSCFVSIPVLATAVTTTTATAERLGLFEQVQMQVWDANAVTKGLEIELITTGDALQRPGWPPHIECVTCR
jgi:hypothetical protein